jgi:hypothetical protein
VVTVRALREGGRKSAGAGVRALFDAAAGVLPAGSEDRRFGLDVEAVRELLASRSAR